MIPSRNFDNFPTFASSGSRVPPDSAKYAAGFVPNDTYPAAWANYFAHGATKGISDLNTVVKSLIDECNNVVIQSGQTPDATDNTQLYTAVRSFSKDRIPISANTVLTVNADTVARITATEPITITLSDSVIVGAQLRVYNTSAYNQTLTARTPDGNNSSVTLLAGSQNSIEWDGAKWISGSAPAVGSIFVQYPQQESPADVYPCSKWELQTQYAGAFFRSSGGNAEAFATSSDTLSSRLQDDMIKTHTTENMSDKATGQFPASSTTFLNQSLTGPFYTIASHSFSMSSGSYGTTHRVIGFNVEHTHTYGNATDNPETRPTNYTVQIWKRIA